MTDWKPPSKAQIERERAARQAEWEAEQALAAEALAKLSAFVDNTYAKGRIESCSPEERRAMTRMFDRRRKLEEALPHDAASTFSRKSGELIAQRMNAERTDCREESGDQGCGCCPVEYTCALDRDHDGPHRSVSTDEYGDKGSRLRRTEVFEWWVQPVETEAAS